MEQHGNQKKSVPCIKCGRGIEPGKVFCPLCLEDMATAPVEPGTPVILPPPMPVTTIRRQPARRIRKPEEQVRSLRITVAWLSAILAVVMVASAITMALLVSRLQKAENTYRPGENYSTNADLIR